MMKKSRLTGLLLLAAFLTSCVSPYQAQMDALHGSYMAGDVSESEYRREMARLRVNDAGWQQQNSNNVTTAAAVGVAAVGVAALLDNNDNHHHHHHYRRPYRRHGRWR